MIFITDQLFPLIQVCMRLASSQNTSHPKWIFPWWAQDASAPLPALSRPDSTFPSPSATLSTPELHPQPGEAGQCLSLSIWGPGPWFVTAATELDESSFTAGLRSIWFGKQGLERASLPVTAQSRSAGFKFRCSRTRCWWTTPAPTSPSSFHNAQVSTNSRHNCLEADGMHSVKYDFFVFCDNYCMFFI